MGRSPAAQLPPLAIALALIAGSAASAAPVAVPASTGPITDLANLVEPERRARLDALLEQVRTSAGVELRVLTLSTLAGEDLAAFSIRVADTWGIGDRQRDDGVLLLVVRDDRRLRLEVGYGLEEKLTDLESARILDEIVVPKLRAGAPGEAIEAGITAVLERLGVAPAPAAADRTIGPVGRRALALLGSALLLFVTLRVACAPGAGPWFVFPCFVLPGYAFYAALVPRAAQGRVALFAVSIAAGVFVALRVWVRHTRAGRRWSQASRLAKLLGADREAERAEPAEKGSRTSWRESSSSRSSSSGGGGFGGGGASSKW